MIKHRFGESGNMWEQDMFGVVNRELFLRDMKRLYKKAEEDPASGVFKRLAEVREGVPSAPPEVQYYESISQVITWNKGMDARNPEKKFASLLRSRVDKLMQEKIDYYKNCDLLYFTAVSDTPVFSDEITKTPLDFYKNTDASFLVVYDGEHYIAKIDGTTNPYDPKDNGADIIVVFDTDNEDENYGDILEMAAYDSFLTLKHRLESKDMLTKPY